MSTQVKIGDSIQITSVVQDAVSKRGNELEVGMNLRITDCLEAGAYSGESLSCRLSLRSADTATTVELYANKPVIRDQNGAEYEYSTL